MRGPWYGRCHTEMVCAQCSLAPSRPGDRGAAIEAAQYELLEKLRAGHGHTQGFEHAAMFVATFALRVGYGEGMLAAPLVV
jgi:hypothetical protein